MPTASPFGFSDPFIPSPRMPNSLSHLSREALPPSLPITACNGPGTIGPIATNDGPASVQASTFRNVSACNRCRLRKHRCDQNLPRCHPCEKAQVRCVGYDPITKHEIPRSYVFWLEHRVGYLKQVLVDHNIGFRAEAAFDEEASSAEAALKIAHSKPVSETPRKRERSVDSGVTSDQQPATFNYKWKLHDPISDLLSGNTAQYEIAKPEAVKSMTNFETNPIQDSFFGLGAGKPGKKLHPKVLASIWKQAQIEEP